MHRYPNSNLSQESLEATAEAVTQEHRVNLHSVRQGQAKRKLPSLPENLTGRMLDHERKEEKGPCLEKRGILDEW